jgi:ABC-type arginine transport system permease subunit
MLILYFIVAFIIFFFNHKKYNKARLEQANTYDFPTVIIFRYILIPLCWIIAIPLLIFWNILELIYNKIIK